MWWSHTKLSKSLDQQPEILCLFLLFIIVFIFVFQVEVYPKILKLGVDHLLLPYIKLF